MAVEVDGGDDGGEGVGAAGVDPQAAPRIPGSHSEAPGCQDTLGVTLVPSPHDEPFVGKF